MPIKLNDTYLAQGACRTEAAAFLPLLRDADEKKSATRAAPAATTSAGSTCPSITTARRSRASRKTAAAIQAHSDVFVVIGIGGSYLGAKAAIDFLRSPNYNTIRKRTPDIYFIGNSFSGSEILEVISLCEGRRRLGQRRLEIGHDDRKRHRLPRDAVLYAEPLLQDELRRRIFATTDAHTGALQAACRRERLRDLRRAGGHRRPLLGPVGRRPAADCGLRGRTSTKT